MNAVTGIPSAQRSELWAGRLADFRKRLNTPVPLVVEGKLVRMVGLTLEAVGCQAPIGARCDVLTSTGNRVEAEVVGFSDEKTILMPTGDIRGLTPNARVIPSKKVCEAVVGDGLLGRVVDASGRPLDGKGPVIADKRVPLTGRLINPLARQPITETLDVGVRSINALLTVGRGQRMGLFAGSGVGKSVLLGMMTRFTAADVVVVGLIGERGREVKEFVQNILGEAGLSRSVVVAAPADQPPLMRMHGAWLTTAIAEYFRDRGLKVLLLMDSLTRFSQAQREIGLAIGEPPATKGYPPSVFAKLAQLVERVGNGDSGSGSITAFYTVLAEGDDHNDPIADAARATLDGHLVLSREIAETGLYPAIDVEASISRVMHDIAGPVHLQAAQRFRQFYSTYQKNKDLIAVGAYQHGADPRIDEAIACQPRLLDFLRQGNSQGINFDDSLEQLGELMAPAQGTGDVLTEGHSV
ncbi:MAG: flagellar protein export ATPase FliI [Gammaproteobacteria bacterium]|nr:flagellar protein export ATPase FliI [Gammaproteobacteria bacterium]